MLPTVSTTISSSSSRRQHRQNVYSSLPPSVYDLGANFFFARFLSEKSGLFGDYFSWLTQLYSTAPSDGLVRAAVEAVGLSALSNVSWAPDVQIKSSEQYSKTLGVLNFVLEDSERAKSDDTLLVITLLILFEVGFPEPCLLFT